MYIWRVIHVWCKLELAHYVGQDEFASVIDEVYDLILATKLISYLTVIIAYCMSRVVFIISNATVLE